MLGRTADDGEAPTGDVAALRAALAAKNAAIEKLKARARDFVARSRAEKAQLEQTVAAQRARARQPLASLPSCVVSNHEC